MVIEKRTYPIQLLNVVGPIWHACYIRRVYIDQKSSLRKRDLKSFDFQILRVERGVNDGAHGLMICYFKTRRNMLGLKYCALRRSIQ